METANIKTVTIYESWITVAANLTDEQKGQFYDAIMRYALYGEEPELAFPLDSFFSLIKPNIDKSNNRKIAGANGGKKSSKSQAKSDRKNKQTVSKTQAKFKQTLTEEEVEEEEEVEVEGDINIIPPACDKFVKLFPREGMRDYQQAVKSAIEAVHRQLDQPGATVESAIEVVESGTINYAAAVSKWSWEEKRFIKDAEKFYKESHYLTDPVKWQSKTENNNRRSDGYDWRNPETWGTETTMGEAK